MDIHKLASEVKNQNDFVQFIKELKKDFILNKQEWENDDLESFLDGIYGYCYDRKQSLNDWNVFAEILLAATVYE